MINIGDLLCRTLWLPYIFLCLGIGYGQNAEQMLMYQVEGNSYIRKNYDQNGKLIETQKFVVGEIEMENNQHSMPVIIYTYDKDGQEVNKSKTLYKCMPYAGVVLLNIMPHASSLGQSESMKFDLKESPNLYPVQWELGASLDDIKVELAKDDGTMNLLGGRGEILLFDRKVTAFNNRAHTYTIEGEMRIKASIWGLNVKTIHYNIEETLHPKKGIVEQVFKEDSGNFFTVTLLN